MILIVAILNSQRPFEGLTGFDSLRTSNLHAKKLLLKVNYHSYQGGCQFWLDLGHPRHYHHPTSPARRYPWSSPDNIFQSPHYSTYPVHYPGYQILFIHSNPVYLTPGSLCTLLFSRSPSVLIYPPPSCPLPIRLKTPSSTPRLSTTTINGY
jgi:hypothetical protein